jgi:hypothetical protein
MLLSHRYKFIFIKTRKTAGTSIEVDLAPFLGPDDVITRIQPPVPGHEPRNYRSPNPVRRWLKRTYHNHAPARIIREIAGRQVYDSYFKFCVDREPVSKCKSMYRMFASDQSFAHYDPSLTWDEYVERGEFPVNDDIYLDRDGSLMVDRILKYENLGDELFEVARQLGIPFEGLQARAKGGLREKGPEIVVSGAQRQRIYDAFAPTLKYTGYTPDG